MSCFVCASSMRRSKHSSEPKIGFRIRSNPDTAIAFVQRNTPDGWKNTGLAVTPDHVITSDGTPEAAAHFRALAATIAAIPDIGEQPLRADTPIPKVFANADRTDLRELNFDGYVQAGTLGQQPDGSIALLALLGVRGASGAAADIVPLVGQISREEVDDACPAYPKVHNNFVGCYCQAQNPEATPQEIGNMVHDEVAAAFEGHPG